MTEEESIEVIRARLERYTRMLYHAGNFLDTQYFNLGTKTIPLYEKMNKAWATMTPEDRAYNDTVLGPNGEKA